MDRRGSSPLARGLRPGRPPPGRAPGIIPARAGFTDRPASAAPRRGDHPRSRGVYAGRVTEEKFRDGSSPLARGLPTAHPVIQALIGIIPARAGFTPHPTGSRSGRPDHPRSRGVYPTTATPYTRPPGSSPLARGLRHRVSFVQAPSRIIPARAGFTPRRSRARSEPPDHPRSRGVYSTRPSSSGSWGGSSPLARGLPTGCGTSRRLGRIIPARAGFTRPAAGPPRPGGGSSPLARGLRAHLRGGQRRDGIIPARAGFTGDDVAAGASGADHPRSRGVYISASLFVPAVLGSSPLARGLRHSAGLFGPHAGIIPARAGFTKPPKNFRCMEKDHPRSRGVYPPRLPDQHGLRGSSPLARGLPPKWERIRCRRGIIPARAGFTTPFSNIPRMLWDHPRSRGVY